MRMVRNYAVLHDNADVLKALLCFQDSKLLVDTMLQSPHVEVVSADVKRWFVIFGQLEEIIDLWDNCQKQVNYDYKLLELTYPYLRANMFMIVIIFSHIFEDNHMFLFRCLHGNFVTFKTY